MYEYYETAAEGVRIRFAGPADVPVILQFIRELAAYEKMLDEVEATEELLRFWLFEKKKAEVIPHPFLKEKVQYGMLPYAQALLLARYIRGDLDDYPAMMWK